MQELSLNILDIAQNSVKAGAKAIDIAVAVDTPADRMVITIADDGCGMSEETLQRVTDPFYTTRTTRKVGLGVPFFKMAAEMTGGSFDIRSALGVGTTVTATFGYSHIDRMPLGDIAATVCQLVQCNEEIEFTFTYRMDSEAFTMDTREFRQILEGVPLSSPEVVLFLREYLNDHLTEITNKKGGQS